ncbi:adenosylmethionine--8-amino-7-oxononanoate transaminase [Marinoscillum furvescens]|uniref:Adenosylmethionine-8-amino-7-oxononanoate aminotransferase n=1 Tax=Marinoscillum furvescens DSM 4134 TaxID=1122208 RepID=A0A3D9KYB7_MARFU|nr:adenosylmethionine--8-amino-7-oxononanoate transaminase [Marinoscillum furvescens]RED92472.1 adenosylmethionine-8-amino-7-oxononanoate aminotransferase [Marinoscillum furvescens DSM 4134]
MLGLTNLEKADQKNIWHPFSPLAGNKPIPVKKAKGVYIHTHDGRKIIDSISSWWVNIHGHSHPKINKAISRQAAKVEQVIFAGFTHRPAIDLSKTLLKLLPKSISKVFFSDNGSTSVEVAIKLAIQYWHNEGKPRRKIIALEGAYHGDTFGSMSVAERNIFSAPFNDFLFEVEFLPFPSGDGKAAIERMQEIVNDDTAAFIFEPLVQGAAGMQMYQPEVLDELLRIAKSKDVICIADEVMTGFGRTGKMFACDYLKEEPDLFCLSKGITGGYLPMGVTAVNERLVKAFDVEDRLKAFFHGHSYTANPLACAAANASMKLLLGKKCQQHIQRISQAHAAFVERFQPTAEVKEVRHRGTILAIELHADDAGYTSSLKEAIYDFFMAKDMLLRPLGNVIYLIPPYIITNDELEKMYAAIEEFLATRQ